MVSHRRDACATNMRVAGRVAGRPEPAGKMARKRRVKRGKEEKVYIMNID